MHRVPCFAITVTASAWLVCPFRGWDGDRHPHATDRNPQKLWPRDGGRHATRNKVLVSWRRHCLRSHGLGAVVGGGWSFILGSERTGPRRATSDPSECRRRRAANDAPRRSRWSGRRRRCRGTNVRPRAGQWRLGLSLGKLCPSWGDRSDRARGCARLLLRAAVGVRPVPHACPITVRVSALLANFFSGIGLPNRKPCTRSKPSSLAATRSARLSTPSATVRAP